MALQAGFGRTLINPPSHIPAGTWMAQKHVRASGLDMDLRATALVLSDGPLSVAIIDLGPVFPLRYAGCRAPTSGSREHRYCA